MYSTGHNGLQIWAKKVEDQHDTLQDRILYGVVMDPFNGCVIPLEVSAFFSLH